LIDQPYQFDFYDGGGLDIAFLSFAQVDWQGSVNVSRFGDKVIGIGGFQNIAQNARKMVFNGTFTAGELQVAWADGKLTILKEGRHPKFLQHLEQISYNGHYAARQGQRALYITERAVFERDEDGLILVEVAPGIDPGREVLAHMQFTPRISPGLREMDARIFEAQPMGLAADILARPRLNLPARLRPGYKAGGGVQ
jgi:propionate CoA-transferase